VTREGERPPPGKGRRARKRRSFAGNYASTNTTGPGRPQARTVTIVDAIVGRKSFVLRTERHIYDLSVSSYALWSYKTGPRKGQPKLVRLKGVHTGRRISIKRYRDARLAADAYHARKRALGIGLLPWRSDEASFAMMGWAQITIAAANSTAGQDLAARMRSLGVPVATAPLRERHPGEFWFADY
jgi:hypothetical protein